MPQKKKIQEILTFHNKISNAFREVHVDGAYGGITPNGYVNLNFFSERAPIPKSSDYVIDQDAQKLLKVEDSKDSKSGIVREYDFGIFMDFKTTKKIIDLLQEKVVELEKYQSKQDGDIN